jgi:nitroreductase
MKKKLLFSVTIVLLMLAGCNSNSEPAKNTFAPSFDEVLTTRRSVRSYDATKKISEAEVRELLLATQEAPSWANQQPTKYYVAISEEKVKAVQDMVGGNKEPESETIMAVISLGYRAQEPKQPQHRPLEDIVKFF